MGRRRHPHSYPTARLAGVCALFVLACGNATNPAATAAAVDNAPGPVGGPHIGQDGTTLEVPKLHRIAGSDRRIGPTTSIAGSTFSSIVHLNAQGLITELNSSVGDLKGPTGSEACWKVVEALTARYGEPESRGIPGVYPERRWTGTKAIVDWKRTGELGTDSYVCQVSWRAALP